MKNVTTKLMIVAAAFVAVAGVASAQTLEAKIPFAFRASGKVFAPGTYRVEMHTGLSGIPVLAIRSLESGPKVLAIVNADGYAKKAWADSGDAVLSFECGVSRCALSKVWMGGANESVYRLPSVSLGKDEPRHVAEIVMQPAKAD